MVQTGFDIISKKLPEKLIGKSAAVLCHSPSINGKYQHIIDFLESNNQIRISAIFGPQHGLFGETQDNMIEWEGYTHPVYDIPVYSLYGKFREPLPDMLTNIEAFIIDLQDIGARPYTYIWTMKHCMEVCGKLGIPVWILDRPNPVSRLGFDGPLLKRDFFTFVGEAEIPLCHNMTIGEIALWINNFESTGCDLNIVWMTGWERGMSFEQTGLPWVPPSPNMPGVNTSVVYPGTVLTEALNLSEGRGTTTPFELFGAPELNSISLLKNLNSRSLPGCRFRPHDYIPTFHKYSQKYCKGIFIHVIDQDKYKPVYTAVNIYEAIIESTPGYLSFNDPPYEYEDSLIPFDILIGDSSIRKVLENGGSIKIEQEKWLDEIESFRAELKQISYY